MPAFSPELENHKAWLGYLQPEGLVVTAQTLVDAGVQIDRGQLPGLQQRFAALTTTVSLSQDREAVGIGNLPLFFEEFLGWLPSHLVGDLRPEPIPENLIVALPDFEETLSPTSALRKFQPKPNDHPWSLLIQKIPNGQDLDQPHATHPRGWEASPTRKFERLLRDTQVHVGLLTNGLEFRLVYAPTKENAGHVTFPVQAMTEIGGRLILGAFHLLLGAHSVLNAPDKRHLHRLLAQSREYQATVSEQLAEQVLAALHELLRGFQSANDLSQGRVLRHPLAQDPHQIYEGLLTVLLRTVFLLFAEDRGLMPGGSVYGNHYGVHALFEKLRRDAEKHADHMDDRFGAWARLLAVFRIVHQGCRHAALKMPPRHGHLFDPNRFPFLEGRSPGDGSVPENLPLVSDGVVFRVLTNLLVLDGERISYRTLDVEEIGSVYQTIMGFGVLVSPGTAIALKGKRKNGSVPAAPIVVLEELLAQPTKDRTKWLKEKADHALTGEAEKALKAAATVDDCLAALSNRIDRTATPGPVHQGRLVLEPTDERRRSGSHYTPRSFTEPIVRKTLEPILRRLVEEASGERRRASGDWPAAPCADHEHPIVSGPGGVAARNEPCRIGLEPDPQLSQGRTVRIDQPVAEGGSLDSRESGRGLGSTKPEGVLSLHPHCPGQPAGTGNPPPPGPAGGLGLRSASEGSLASCSDPWPPAYRPVTKPDADRPGDGERESSEQRAVSGEQLQGAPLSTPPPSLPHRSPLAPPPPLAARRSPLTTSPTPTPSSLLSLKIADIAVGSAAFLVETCRQLAEVLVRGWRVHGGRPELPPDETEELLAMRLIAQRCLYGVDRNPMAVDLAKLSLWLATLAKDHPFTFLDHAIRCGDSLVGLTRQQIEDFTWGDTRSHQRQFFAEEVRKRTAAALRERQNLLALGDDYGTPQLKREKLEKADELLNLVRFIGDAAIAAFFSADKPKAREAKREELAERIADYLGKGDLQQRPTDEVKALRGGQFPVTPFHWEIEYPEVFDRENPGFDGIVGNPPFLGGRRTSTTLGDTFSGWLSTTNEESSNNADLAAFFFRRAFGSLRADGSFGLLATNTIAQGDTRQTGLRWIRKSGGNIFDVVKRLKWPGQAAVVVSVVHVRKGPAKFGCTLDGVVVPTITAYLNPSGTDESPASLQENAGRGFQGVIPLGIGFTFDDNDGTGKASPLARMHELITQNPHNAERIFTIIGGEEVLGSPIHAASRYVIDFGEMSLEEATRWPELISILRDRALPDRVDQKRAHLRERWWQFAETRPALRQAVKGLPRVLMHPFTSSHLAFAFLSPKILVAGPHQVFALSTDNAFSVVQSRTHEVWARFFASSLKDDLRYTPSDCFETFPFPVAYDTNAALESAGRDYYDFRAALMQDLWLGLTEIYNLFHAPDEEGLARLEILYRKRAANNEWRTVEKVPSDRSPLTAHRSPAAALGGVRHLRELHAAMDTAVLTAYGWEDLVPRCTCEFLLDYEDEEASSEQGAASEEDASDRSPLATPRSRARKRPWRYRWPDEVRDEVLARLLKLNAERAEQERILGVAARGPSQKQSKHKYRPSAAIPLQGDLLPGPQGDLFA